jgi:hypothetical protein
MARKLRVQYAGAIYHVMNRGDRREAPSHLACLLYRHKKNNLNNESSENNTLFSHRSALSPADRICFRVNRDGTASSTIGCTSPMQTRLNLTLQTLESVRFW